MFFLILELDCVSCREKKVQALQYLFMMLPPLNRLLLKKLLELLRMVAEDQSSKMTSYNLGVVFAPNIICDRQVPVCIMLLSHHSMSLRHAVREQAVCHILVL